MINSQEDMINSHVLIQSRVEEEWAQYRVDMSMETAGTLTEKQLRDNFVRDQYNRIKREVMSDVIVAIPSKRSRSRSPVRQRSKVLLTIAAQKDRC